VVLRPQQAHRGFTVIPLAAQHPPDHVAQRQPLHFEFLVGIGRGGAQLEALRQIEVNDFGENAGRRQEGAKRGPACRGDSGFFM
jgi:hypothetical protein